MTGLRQLLAGAAVASAMVLAGGAAGAESQLHVQVITGSEPGFLANATLVSGEKDAILVDAGFTLADAHRIAGAILDARRNLTTVYVTHFHPDHYFGVVVIKQAFPKAKLVALPATVADIKKSWQGKVKQWGPMYGDNLTTKPVIPAALTGTTLTLEGQTLEIHGPTQGDAPTNSYVWISSLKTAIAGDIVYSGVYPWTAETDATTRQAWIKTLDELAAYGPTAVVAGHRDPRLPADDPAALAQTRAYLLAFDEAAAASKTADDLEAKMKAKYPGLELPIILHIAATSQFAQAASAKK